MDGTSLEWEPCDLILEELGQKKKTVMASVRGDRQKKVTKSSSCFRGNKFIF